MPDVSVIIPCYNSEHFIKETLNSVIAQTHNSWECIVVDDGSTDNSVQIVLSLAANDSRIRFYKRSSSNKGASACRNEGAKMSNADYIIFLDSDDLLRKDCIESRLTKISQSPDQDLWVFYCELFKEKPGDTGVLWNIKDGDDDLGRYIAHDLTWHTTSPIWKKTSFLELGGFDEKALCMQDWEVHLRALSSGLKYIYYDDPPDCYYRKNHGANTISSQKATDSKLESREYLLRKHYQVLKSVGQLEGEKKYNFTSYFIQLISLNLSVEKYEKADELLAFLVSEKLMNSRGKKILRKTLKLANKKNRTIVDRVVLKGLIYIRNMILSQEYFPKSNQYAYTYSDYKKNRHGAA